MTQNNKINIYVALIGAIGLIISTLISKCSNDIPNENPKIEKIAEHNTNDYTLSQTPLSKNKLLETKHIKISNIRADTAWHTILESPPYLKEEVAKNFEGIKVKWDVAIQQISKTDEDKVHVMSLYKGGYPWIYFDVDISEYPILKTLEKDTNITITGTILNSSNGGFEINLDKLE